VNVSLTSVDIFACLTCFWHQRKFQINNREYNNMNCTVAVWRHFLRLRVITEYCLASVYAHITNIKEIKINLLMSATKLISQFMSSTINHWNICLNSTRMYCINNIFEQFTIILMHPFWPRGFPFSPRASHFQHWFFCTSEITKTMILSVEGYLDMYLILLY